MMGRYSEESRFAFYRYVHCNIQGQNLHVDSRCEINKHNFVFTYQLYKFMLIVFIFPITVRLLQNNECGFPLIFTITVVELFLITRIGITLSKNTIRKQNKQSISIISEQPPQHAQ
jgi:hypothetical protein